MKTIQQKLRELNACKPALEWAEGKTWEEIYATCHRGDWLLWLFKRTNPDDLQRLTLAKGHCVDTVSHLMKDERSKDAVQSAIDFGNGLIDSEQLAAAADAAYAAADAAYAAAAYAAADAAADAAYAAAADAAYAAAADAAYAAADAAYAAAADAAAYAAARTKNQLETANICRKYLPIEIWNI